MSLASIVLAAVLSQAVVDGLKSVYNGFLADVQKTTVAKPVPPKVD